MNPYFLLLQPLTVIPLHGLLIFFIKFRPPERGLDGKLQKLKKSARIKVIIGYFLATVILLACVLVCFVLDA